MAALGFDLSWVVLPVEKLHALSQFGPASSRACGGRLKACPGLEEGEGGISAVASLAMGVGGGSGTRIRGLDRGGCSGWGGGGSRFGMFWVLCQRLVPLTCSGVLRGRVDRRMGGGGGVGVGEGGGALREAVCFRHVFVYL